MSFNPDTAREIKSPWSAPSPFLREQGDFSPHVLPADAVEEAEVVEVPKAPVPVPAAGDSLVPELDIAVNPADDSDLYPDGMNPGAFSEVLS